MFKWHAQNSGKEVFCRHCFVNIVLNELDCGLPQPDANKRQNSKQGAMQNEIKSHGAETKRDTAVRYADDLKFSGATHEDAVRAYKATELVLQAGAGNCPDKSKVVNLSILIFSKP